MRLHCSEILHMLRHKPILLSMPNGEPVLTPVTASIRRKLLMPLLPLIHQAEKIIFDSGSDQDARTITAVRDTSTNMVEAGLFHQPHRVVWVEDPYEDNAENHRNCYLAIETDTGITLHFFSRMKEIIGLGLPELVWHPYPLVIPLNEVTDQFVIRGVETVSPLYAKVLGEAVYAYKKLIVTLASTNPVVERITTGGRRDDTRYRVYDHRIVRIPLDRPDSGKPQPVASGSSAPPRRRHLVRGFVWGKNTRPVEQQHWVKPYWRGEQERGTKEHSHYEVPR